MSAARGKAYLIGDPASIEIGAGPQEKWAVATDRMLGVTASALERACQAAVFSDAYQAQLASAVRVASNAHARASSVTAVWGMRPAFLSRAPVGKSFRKASGRRAAST